MSRYLSKSQFTRGLQCQKSLWLYRNQRELRQEPDAYARMIFDQGTEIGELAQKRFPGGVLITEDHLHPEEAEASTEKAVYDGAKILYEAAAIHDGTLVRADVLVNNGDDTWDLIEVKSSTGVKEVHIQDLAIQRYVLIGAGYNIRKCFLMHVDKEYNRDGEIDLEGLFILSDETAKVEAQDVTERVRLFREVVAQKDAPDVEIGAHCDKPYPCDFKANCCWKDVPKDSVWSIGGIRKKKAEDLWQKGIHRITEVPVGARMSAKQARQVEITKKGETFINRGAIRKHLSELKYPLHFLDFEAVAPGLPPYDGLSPYQVLPFQASVHIVEAPGADLVHREILAEPDSDPRGPLAKFLAGVISSGTVIAYNASYEGQCLTTLAAGVPSLASAMVEMKDWLWDLANAFRSGHYMSPAFNGSWSLKKILPVLVPEMSYADMEIAEGGSASAIYWDAMRGRLTGSEREKTFAALRVYCAQDTLAMVKVLRWLEAATAKTSA